MAQEAYGSPVEILLVEDSPGDIRLTKEALREAKIRNNLNVVTDGVEAMEYLLTRGKYSGATTPDLILLDLNMPKKDGREVLRDQGGFATQTYSRGDFDNFGCRTRCLPELRAPCELLYHEAGGSESVSERRAVDREFLVKHRDVTQ